MTREERRRAYRADVTYVTAKEAGFDYLRDLLVFDKDDVVHRPLRVAIVDEADSLLIDEGRVPLVIAGHVEQHESNARQLAGLVASFREGEHFTTDEYARDVELTDPGIDLAERALGCGGLHDPQNILLLAELQCALHAHALLRRDVDYIVRHGRVELVDELTGRVVVDRHWPDGLQAALEAKENIAATTGGRILGSITMQHFLRRYPRFCGMTGTAQGAAAELFDPYGLRVTVIPTNRLVRRIDHADVVFADRAGKEEAVVAEVGRAHAQGQPVLIGTLTWRSRSESPSGREGVHLVTLGGMDPLSYYTSAMVAAYTSLVERLDRDVVEALSRVTADGSRLDLAGFDVKGPSSTWTYVVNDDPFRDHIARLLTGPGGATIAVYAVAVLTPLLVLWGTIDGLRRRGRH